MRACTRAHPSIHSDYARSIPVFLFVQSLTGIGRTSRENIPRKLNGNSKKISKCGIRTADLPDAGRGLTHATTASPSKLVDFQFGIHQIKLTPNSTFFEITLHFLTLRIEEFWWIYSPSLVSKLQNNSVFYWILFELWTGMSCYIYRFGSPS